MSFGGARKFIALTFLQSPQMSCEPAPSLYILFSSFLKDCDRLAFYFEITNRMCAPFLNNLAMKMPETSHFSQTDLNNINTEKCNDEKCIKRRRRWAVFKGLDLPSSAAAPRPGPATCPGPIPPPGSCTRPRNRSHSAPCSPSSSSSSSSSRLKALFSDGSLAAVFWLVLVLLTRRTSVPGCPTSGRDAVISTEESRDGSVHTAPPTPPH